MGAFHEGHLSLMRRARAECDVVVVSLFVNPAQFGAGEDLDAYPRDEAADAAAAEAQGADLLFAPSAERGLSAGLRDGRGGARADRRALRRAPPAAAPSTSAA